MNETEWLEWRKGKASASKIAAAHTGKYGGMFKAVGHDLGLIPDEDTAVMRRGHAYEERIADMVLYAKGLHVLGEQLLVVSQTNPRHTATLDGLLSAEPEATLDDCEALLEIKTKGTHVRAPWGYWNAQIQFQQMVAGFDRTLLAVATIDDVDDELTNLQFQWIDADPFQQEQLAETADRFLNYIDTETMPAPDTWEALDYVKANQPAANKEAAPVALDAEKVVRLHTLKAAEKSAEKERKVLEAEILIELGEATRGEADGFTVSLSQNRKVMTATAADALLLVHPEFAKTVLDKDKAKAAGIYEQFVEPVGSRTLTIREKKT